MNNACPSCGAVYAVSAKDVGRKLKCKKCGSALVVSDAGLVEDTPAASPPPPPAAVAVVEEVDDFDTGDDEIVSTKGKKGKKSLPSLGGLGKSAPSIGPLVSKLGGVPTMLFGFGVFLVIWFIFMSKIGEAAILRAEAYTQKLEAERDAKIKALAKGKAPPTKEDELKKFMEDSKKIGEEYETRIAEAQEDARITQINNYRDIWFDRWGTMFGFMFVAFGCIGYLRTEQPLVMRIVAAVILAFMMMAIFFPFTGCGGGEKLPSLSSKPPGGGGKGGGMGMP